MRDVIRAAEAACQAQFQKIDEIAEYRSNAVLSAFSKHRVSDSYFAGTTGYGYDDLGRDKLEAIYADVFGTEDALVRLQFVNGTHAIGCAMFAGLKSGDTLLSVSGHPYDTLQSVVGLNDKYPGSFRDFGIHYKMLELKDGKPDLHAIHTAVSEDTTIKTVFLQRSRGYTTRAALTLDDIRAVSDCVKSVREDICVLVDNCYGEFVEREEPTMCGADLMAGSLIKNPGGGLAAGGGYIAGKAKYVEAADMRKTVPGIGRECGGTYGQNRLLYHGFFFAPHTTAQAHKTAVFCASLMSSLGYQVSPSVSDVRHDLIQTVALGDPELVKKFCRGVQAGAPVDSFVTPEPYAMPGYDCDVIMAAGAFIQGSSIELSADAPMREPYLVYLQGGLTYESGKAGIIKAAEYMQK